MQTKYESSSTPSNPQHSTALPPIQSIATSELSPVVKNASLAGLVAVIFGSLIASLMASPSPEEIASQSVEIEPVASTSTETTSSIIAVEPETTTPSTATITSVPETDTATTTSTTALTDTDSAIEITESEPDITEPDVTEATAGATTSTLTSEANIETETTASIPTTPEVETETIASASVTPEVETTTPEESITPEVEPETSASIESEPMPPVDIETTELPTDSDPAGTPSAQPDTLNRAEEAEESEIAASTPETTTEETVTAAATSAVNTTELSQSLYNQIDSSWSIPVDGESVYVVKLNSEGDVLGYEPKSQVAKNNAENTPLPTLVKSDATSTETAAEFEVVFSTSGILEVNDFKSP